MTYIEIVLAIDAIAVVAVLILGIRALMRKGNDGP